MKLVELEKMRLQIVRFDLTSPVLYFGDGYDYQVRIEQNFVIEVEGKKASIGTDVVEHPKRKRVYRGASELLALLGETVVKATGNEDGSLDINFGEAGSLHVPADPDYEAWTYTSPKGALVSLPGGGLG